MAYDSWKVLAEDVVDVSEANRIKIQMSENLRTKKVSLTLNKQYRDKDTSEWKWGRGFMIPQEDTIEFLQKIAEVMGLEVQIAIDDST
jgi:hypothetical protein